jgi:hypothetical protein
MGGSEQLKRGRFAVAVAAAIFYWLLSAWSPVSFAALTFDEAQQIIVSGSLDDAEEEGLEPAPDLFPIPGSGRPSNGWTRKFAADPGPAPHSHAQRLSRARDPPNLNA